MKKIYTAPSVEMTTFESENTMTVFKSGVITYKGTTMTDATKDLVDF